MLRQDERDRVERRLLEERGRALEALSEFDEGFARTLQDTTGDLSIYRLHMADVASESMEREQQFLLASRDGERLFRIDSALRRLYDDAEGFGRCSSCGEAIGVERLEMLPDVDRCADCQRNAEE